MSNRVIIIGAGFGGIGMAVSLLRHGIRDVTVVDGSDGIGGTWRANSYPGAGCDVPSHLYSFSFFPKPDWERRYATQPEILRYLEDCARRFGIDRHLRLRTVVTAMRWLAPRGVWELDTASGERLEAEVVVSAVGQLNQPQLPRIRGIDRFAGPAFHSARWRHDVDLAGRRVAVIGTGASAIQFVPHVARAAGHTTVLQRSAPYLIHKHDRVYSAREKRLYGRLPWLLSGTRLKEYLGHELRAVLFVSAPSAMRLLAGVSRYRLRRAVREPRLQAAVTPDYPFGCKRLLLTNDWHDVIQRDDVTLVTEEVREVVPDGLVTADGRHHSCDVLIYGTGFAATDFLTPMRVTGRDGRDLHELWRDAPSAYLGISVAGFPNLFLLYGPQTNLSHSSIVYMLESQIRYVTDAVRTLGEHRLSWLDVRPHVQAQWDGQMRERSSRTIWESGCRSWYTTADGRNVNNWPGYTFDYRRRTRHLDLGDYETAPA